MKEIKKVVLFYGYPSVGGIERIIAEEVKYFSKKGIETHVLTHTFNEDAKLFSGIYKVNIEEVCREREPSKNILIKAMRSILGLRRKLKELKPDIIISQSMPDCVYLFFATLFTPYIYVTHIAETIFWLNDQKTSLAKYALIHKKVFKEIRNSVIGHKEFIQPTPPKMSLIKRMLVEFSAITMYIGVRKAKKIFCHSKQMIWEVGKLYGKNKDAIALKGAFHSEILGYKPKQDIKGKLGLQNKKMILNVNRLDAKKRVDLLLRAFKNISERFNDVILVIGGIGPEEENLKRLAKELGIVDKVKFVGFIEEEDLWDYYASCDVFVHPNWADFAIAPYEALALQKKVVWSTEMEMDKSIMKNKHIFTADPTVKDFAKAIEKALNTEITEKNDMTMYTWDKYCERIYNEISELNRRRSI